MDMEFEEFKQEANEFKRIVERYKEYLKLLSNSITEEEDVIVSEEMY